MTVLLHFNIFDIHESIYLFTVRRRLYGITILVNIKRDLLRLDLLCELDILS